MPDRGRDSARSGAATGWQPNETCRTTAKRRPAEPACHRAPGGRWRRRGAPREGQQQDTLRADAANDQVRHAMGERHGLAGPGARDHEQRPGRKVTPGRLPAVPGGLALPRIQHVQVFIQPFGNLHGDLPSKTICIFIQYWMNLQGIPRVAPQAPRAARNAACAPNPRSRPPANRGTAGRAAAGNRCAGRRPAARGP